MLVLGTRTRRITASQVDITPEFRVHGRETTLAPGRTCQCLGPVKVIFGHHHPCQPQARRMPDSVGTGMVQGPLQLGMCRRQLPLLKLQLRQCQRSQRRIGGRTEVGDEDTRLFIDQAFLQQVAQEQGK